MNKPIADLHCHPAMKPFGKSFMRRYTTGENNKNIHEENSIWHQQRPKLFRKVLNVLLTLTKWRQSDCQTLLEGNNRVIMASLYPLEKGMISNKRVGDLKFFDRVLRNLVKGVSMRRIRHLQKMPDYYADLNAEYDFYKQLHNKRFLINGVRKRYKMIGKAEDLELEDENCINVLMSIEGAHVFNCGLQLEGQPVADWAEVQKNIKEVKNWDYRPIFVTLAHHFYNELCGFAKSFEGGVADIMQQNADPEVGMTTAGYAVIKTMLKNTAEKEGESNRILVDVKHMNVKSRYEYYAFLKKEYPDENIPIIVSHGAINGKLDPKTKKVKSLGFNAADINFFYEELKIIQQSKGIFGLQLDERRIYDAKLKNEVFEHAEKKMTKYGKKRLRKGAYYIWRQIEKIGDYLDQEGLSAWDVQALGTDYDGIINPLNGWWTSRELKDLGPYLTHHASDFLKTHRGQTLKDFNKLSAEEIVEKFMSTNAIEFIKRNF